MTNSTLYSRARVDDLELLRGPLFTSLFGTSMFCFLSPAPLLLWLTKQERKDTERVQDASFPQKRQDEDPERESPEKKVQQTS